ncbi:MAG: dihydroneopterin aldolase [Vulcanimicrobiaceae bacterium]
MDLIEIRGIVAQGRHGANPGEREREQPFEVDLKLEVDLSAAQQSDDLAQTVDYAGLHGDVVRIVSQQSYALLERLAGAIVETVFRDRRIVRAEVRVGKPRLLDGATPCVTLRRENSKDRS